MFIINKVKAGVAERDMDCMHLRDGAGRTRISADQLTGILILGTTLRLLAHGGGSYG